MDDGDMGSGVVGGDFLPSAAATCEQFVGRETHTRNFDTHRPTSHNKDPCRPPKARLLEPQCRLVVGAACRRLGPEW